MKCSLLKRGKVWYITYNEKQLDGTYKKRFVTTKETNKTKAEKIMTDFQYKINHGGYVKPEQMTYRDLLNQWYEKHVQQNLEKSTAIEYKSQIDKHLIPKLGSIKVQELTPSHIEDYYQYLLKEGRLDGNGGLSQNTIRRHHATIHKSLDYALKKQIVLRNVAEAICLPKKKKFEINILSKQCFDNLLDVVNKQSSIEIKTIIHLAGGAGLRRSEMCGLQWKDIDFAKKVIYIKHARVHIRTGGWIIKDTKNKSSYRKINITTTLVNILKEIYNEQQEIRKTLKDQYIINDYVLKAYDGSLRDPSHISHLFSDFLENNKLTHIRLHDLRHIYASLLLNNKKIPYKYIQSQTGHSNITTLFDTYGHTIQDYESEMVDEIEKSIYH